MQKKGDFKGNDGGKKKLGELNAKLEPTNTSRSNPDTEKLGYAVESEPTSKSCGFSGLVEFKGID